METLEQLKRRGEAYLKLLAYAQCEEAMTSVDFYAEDGSPVYKDNVETVLQAHGYDEARHIIPGHFLDELRREALKLAKAAT